MRPPRMPVPDTVESEIYVEEAIWGHRLYNEQTPWMTLLEMLGVLASRQKVDAFCEAENFGGVSIEAPRRMALRNVLFNNPHLDSVERRYANNDERWTAWLSKMKEGAKGVDDTDFSYLQRVFVDHENSFEQFAELVRLLRSTAIEGDSNKRWSSKFVFPYGPACLYPDLKVGQKGETSVDRRFFGRTGEVLYLMLCRSGRGDRLFERLKPVVLDPSKPWNRLIERMQPPVEPTPSSAKIGFLPYQRHLEFTALADDLITVLDAQLPGYDSLPHLADLVGLHLVLYTLRRAVEWAPQQGRLSLVLEIIAPRRTPVRDLAIDSFTRNNQRPWSAIESFLDESIAQSSAWRDASAIESAEARDEALWTALREAIHAERPKESDAAPFANPERLFAWMRDRVQIRHEQHFALLHTAYSQAIGLASRRGARRTRYAPSDQLLKTLVLTVVPAGRRMEFKQFLEALWERYSMVIGSHQAGEFLEGGADKSDFDENARRLELRLASLGLLTRLSDACAFVVSPVGGKR